MLLLATRVVTEQDAKAESAPAAHRAGFVAIVGRPNVGKSTLLNQLLGQKVAIVSPKPQTTRGRILGVLTRPGAQLAFLDTPGLHEGRGLLNQRMVRRAREAMEEADVVLWVLDAVDGVTAEDEALARELAALGPRLCIALNKNDKLKKNDLLPILARLDQLLPGIDVVPISASERLNFAELLRELERRLPESPPLYEADQFTDQTETALVAEMVREQVILQTRHEVPYAVAVTVDRFEDKENVTVIHATIHVERESQKPILIGHKGSKIKAIGQAARKEIEALLGRRVYLELFVRVQEGWTKDERRLREFGL